MLTGCLRAIREERGAFRDYESIKEHPIKIGINFEKPWIGTKLFLKHKGRGKELEKMPICPLPNQPKTL